MREILFRGKNTDSGEWAEGYLVQTQSHTYIIQPGWYKDDLFISLYNIIDEVDPETVGQFTGLTDKNGKKIFEGDLLNGFQYPFYRSESADHNYFAEVIWFTGNCAFGLYTHKHQTAKVRGISAGNADFIEDFDSDDWEVIGNIHDNPELLEATT